MKVECPKCSEQFAITNELAFKDTNVTWALTIEEGHMIQLRTFCESLNAVGKLLKAVAKEDGFNCEVLLAGLSFTSTKISATVAIVGLTPRKTGCTE